MSESDLPEELHIVKTFQWVIVFNNKVMVTLGINATPEQVQIYLDGFNAQMDELLKQKLGPEYTTEKAVAARVECIDISHLTDNEAPPSPILLPGVKKLKVAPVNPR